MNAQTQGELILPPRSTDELLREKLSALVEEANAEHGERRAELHREIVRLRAILNGRGGA